MITRAATAAKQHGIELVISYIMPISENPLRYENRLRWFSPQGAERKAYLKYHPVPGEPAVPDGVDPAGADRSLSRRGVSEAPRVARFWRSRQRAQLAVDSPRPGAEPTWFQSVRLG